MCGRSRSTTETPLTMATAACSRDDDVGTAAFLLQHYLFITQHTRHSSLKMVSDKGV